MSFSCFDPAEILARFEPFENRIKDVLPENIGPDNFDYPTISVQTDSTPVPREQPDLSYNPFHNLGTSIFDDGHALELAAIHFVYKIMEDEQVYLALNAGPGSWIQYLQFMFPRAYGFGVTSKDKNWKIRELGLNLENFILHYGDDGTGDLRDPRNRFSSSKWIMEYVASTNGEGFLEEGVDLVVANGDMLLPELWTGVNCLRKNGNLIIRLNYPDDPTVLQACYLTSKLFERSTLFKPVSSHPAKSECFLVCHHLQSADPDDYLDMLARILDVSTEPSNIITAVPERFEKWYRQTLSLIQLNQDRYLSENPPNYDFARVHILWGLPLVDRTYTPWHFQLKQRNFPETVLYPEEEARQESSSIQHVITSRKRDRVLEQKLRDIMTQYQGRHIPKADIYTDSTNLDMLVSSLVIVMAERKYPYPLLSTFLNPPPGSISEWLGDYFTEKDNPEWYRYGNTVRKVVMATLSDPTLTELDYATLRAHIDTPPKITAAHLIDVWTDAKVSTVLDVFVRNGEGILAAAILDIGYIGHDPVGSNQPGYTKMVEFLQPKLDHSVGVVTILPADARVDLLYVNPVKPSDMDKKDWLIGSVFPTLRQAWSNLIEGGQIYLEHSDYTSDISNYIDLDLGWIKGASVDLARRTNAFEFFRQNYGLSNLPAPGISVLDSLDDFPYYYRMDGFPDASTMFANLQQAARVFPPAKNTLEEYVELTAKAVAKRKPDLIPSANLAELFNLDMSPSQRLERLRSWYGNGTYTAPDQLKRAEDRAILIKERISDTRFAPTSMLDIGAGSGDISTAVARAYNISPSKTFIVEPHGTPSTDYQLLQYSSDGSIPLEDGSVDLILLFQVLHHIPLADRAKLIAEISRVLAPGGVIVIREHDTDYDPNYETYIGLIHDMDEIDSDIPQGQTHLMSRSELKMYMSQSGLFADPVRYHNYGGAPNPQRIYHDVYLKPSARAPIPLDSFVRTDTRIVNRKWPEDYMTTDFVSNHFTEIQRMTCNISGKPSPMQYWHSLSFSERANLLRRGIPYANDKMYDYICTNFNPAFCLNVILTLVGYKAKILDPSAGWGDRMIAALAARAIYYTATDPNTLLQPAYEKIVETLGPLVGHMSVENIRKTFKVFPKYFEEANVREGFYDLALTSPPYYTYEEYHNARLDLSYSDWLQQVYRPYLANMVKGVKISGYVVIYVGDISIDHTPYKLATDTVLIMDEYVQQGRLRVMAPFGFRANTVTAQGNLRQGKVRTALVWRKIGQISS